MEVFINYLIATSSEKVYNISDEVNKNEREISNRNRKKNK